MNNFLIALDIFLIAVIIAFLVNWLWQRMNAKKLGGELSNEEFEHTMRKAQIIDVREQKEFKQKHITGARNLPMTTIKLQYKELRKDMPVYLYSDSKSVTLKAARFLHKHGYNDIKWLRDGFENWEGMTKKSKY
ncbi:MAG: rhodanese-like domain-containing protein [Lactobacillus sp.]|jgi:rhodanese-related sulfurtransferase|nr:rhodanese-like domain-containing protein [Lactobacillus sp.]